MIRAFVGLGPTQTSNRSDVSHGATAARSCLCDLDIPLHAAGRLPQRQFAQRNEIALLKEILKSPLRLRRDVDLAGREPLHQLVGRDVDQLDFVGSLQHRVRQRFLDRHAGDLGDHVVETFDVLDVERRPNIDAGRKQFLDILPALWMPHPRRIRVGQFVDQEQCRAVAPGPRPDRTREAPRRDT